MKDPIESVAAPSGGPDHRDAAQMFAALGAEPRLAVLRRLVRAGPEGLATGQLQASLGLPASTLSHHIRVLTQTGLVRQDRDGRSLICRAEFATVEGLARFLIEECCRDSAAGENAA